jgi:hypothetical protein
MAADSYAASEARRPSAAAGHGVGPEPGQDSGRSFAEVRAEAREALNRWRGIASRKAAACLLITVGVPLIRGEFVRLHEDGEAEFRINVGLADVVPFSHDCRPCERTPMTTNPEAQVEASRLMQEASRQLGLMTRRLDRPSDSYAILGNLLDTQRSLGQVLRQLSEWQRQTAPGVHYAAHHSESALGVMTTVAELELAAQQADGLQQTMSRTYGGSSAVRWFDEVQQSGE